MAFHADKAAYFKRALLAKHPVRPPARLPRLLPPERLTVQYRRDLESIVKYTKEQIDKRIVPLLAGAVAHYARVRKDAAGDDFAWFQTDLPTLAEELEKVRIQVGEEYTQDEIKRLARLTGRSVAEWNEKQMNGQLRSIAEIDLFGNEPWLAREMGGFLSENVGLISSISDEYLGQVGKILATAIRSGQRADAIADELSDRYDVSLNRAKVISRDQIGKFNGQLTELRQKDLGIEGYTWRGVGDARERDTHVLLNNTKHTWDDPPMVGHPGEDILCRCWAEPDLAKFYEKAA